MNNPVNKQLIFEHFADRITVLQRQMIAQWLEDPANRERYYEWLEEWETQNPQYDIDVERALQQTLQNIQESPAETVRQLPSSGSTAFFSWRWAAAMAGLLLLAGLYMGRSSILYRSHETAYGEVRKVVLPEGSEVVLNANSSLRYSRFNFGDDVRQVFLTGEASFDVRHLKNHTPFVVKTGRDLDVLVLGTEFTVYSRPRGVKVVLERGKVEIVQKVDTAARRLTLKPGDLVSLDSTGSLKMKHVARPQVYASWQAHRYEFDETSLSEIADMLEDNYGLHVQIADSTLAHRTVSGTFSTRTANELSQVIADLLDVSVSRKGNQIMFAHPVTP